MKDNYYLQESPHYGPILYLYVLPEVRVLCVKFYGDGGRTIISCGLPYPRVSLSVISEICPWVMNFSFVGGCTSLAIPDMKRHRDVLAEVVRVLAEGTRHRFVSWTCEPNKPTPISNFRPKGTGILACTVACTHVQDTLAWHATLHMKHASSF